MRYYVITETGSDNIAPAGAFTHHELYREREHAVEAIEAINDQNHNYPGLEWTTWEGNELGKFLGGTLLITGVETEE